MQAGISRHPGRIPAPVMTCHFPSALSVAPAASKAPCAHPPSPFLALPLLIPLGSGCVLLAAALPTGLYGFSSKAALKTLSQLPNGWIMTQQNPPDWEIQSNKAGSDGEGSQRETRCFSNHIPCKTLFFLRLFARLSSPGHSCVASLMSNRVEQALGRLLFLFPGCVPSKELV